MPVRKGLEVDRRVGIALSALTPAQRGAVERALQSPQRFAAHVANSANVKHIEGGDPPLYYLRVTPKLRLVYEDRPSGFRVVDLVDRATVARFAGKQSKKSKKLPVSGLTGQSGSPKTATDKVG
jgi:hypothetical protein